MKSIKIKFRTTAKTYEYLTDLDVKAGDYVVVDSPYDHYTVVEVVDVNSSAEGSKATAYVVCKVDDTEYVARKERKKRAKDIEEKLKARLAKQEKLMMFEILAKEDGEAAALLKELKEII